jgi:hypothetical protein
VRSPLFPNTIFVDNRSHYTLIGTTGIKNKHGLLELLHLFYDWFVESDMVMMETIGKESSVYTLHQVDYKTC